MTSQGAQSAIRNPLKARHSCNPPQAAIRYKQLLAHLAPPRGGSNPGTPPEKRLRRAHRHSSSTPSSSARKV
eukprot:7272832-Alexandrium_andersonii.AAC.1